jgi:hypothetical protein
MDGIVRPLGVNSLAPGHNGSPGGRRGFPDVLSDPGLFTDMCPDAIGVFSRSGTGNDRSPSGIPDDALMPPTMPCRPCGTQRNLESRVILSFTCIGLAPL